MAPLWLLRSTGAMTERRGKGDRRDLRHGGRRRDDPAADCVWLPRDWAPTPKCPVLVAIDEAADWRKTGRSFRDACAGQPLVILAPNIAAHTTDSLIKWIRDVSRECAGGGSYFVYGRARAAPIAASLALREAAATVALALVSPPRRLAWSTYGPRDGDLDAAAGIHVRAMFGAADPALEARLYEWRETAAAAERAGLQHVDVAIVDGTGHSYFIEETLRFFEDAVVSASARAGGTSA